MEKRWSAFEFGQRQQEVRTVNALKSFEHVSIGKKFSICFVSIVFSLLGKGMRGQRGATESISLVLIFVNLPTS